MSLLLSAVATWPVTVRAAALTPEQLRKIRAATFEVVVAKNEPAAVKYEKPLPLELLPFQERNDHYWSIGTAFAIAPGRYASAAHVYSASVGGPFGPVSIRDAAGNVYPIREVTRYSEAEDFVVFAVDGTPPGTVLPTSTTYAIDAPVFAVGNALGEGVIARDGLLNSMTPEAIDGRWKWLRFSAATSPGNSGGPLLDAQGRIIGIVIGMSPNENLNFALPIDRVLSDRGTTARFEFRGTYRWPHLRDPVIADFRRDTPLPLPAAQFSKWLLSLTAQLMDQQRAQLLADPSVDLFPRGDADAVLATQVRSSDPRLIVQGRDLAWETGEVSAEHQVTLPERGRVWLADTGSQVSLFRVSDPTAAGARAADDPQVLMERLLKVFRLTRAVGTQAIRITSFGPPLSDRRFVDRFGRPWICNAWTLGYADMSIVTASLVTPDGRLGFASVGSGRQVAALTGNLQMLADQLQVAFEGTLPQWEAFLAARESRAAVFDAVNVRRDPGGNFRFDTQRFTVDLPSKVMVVDDRSHLKVMTSYLLQDAQLAWDVTGLDLHNDGIADTTLRVERQSRPGPQAGKKAQARWEQMSTLTGDFVPTAGMDSKLKEFWIRVVAPSQGGTGADQAAALYEILFDTTEPKLPRELDEVRGVLRDAVVIRKP